MKAQRKSDKLRDMDIPMVMGIELDRETLTPIRKPLPKFPGVDYGSDPIGNGQYRMVPSGDIVDQCERDKRLKPI